MLRRAASNACCGAAAARRAAGGGRGRLQQHMAAVSNSRQRDGGSSSSSSGGQWAAAGFSTLRAAPLSSRVGLVLYAPGRRQEQQGKMLPPLAPAQWRALLSTAPPSKHEDDKASPVSPAAAGSSSTPPPSSAAATEEPAATTKKKPTWKDMLKKHGPVFLVYWNGMWLLSGLTIYAGLTLGGLDPLPLAYAINLDRLIDLSRLDPAHGNVAVAIVLNEAAELVRFPLVVATVPRVTRWWEGVRPDWLKPKLGPDGKPLPTLADRVRRHGPVFVVWWGTLWVAGAAALFGAFEYHLLGDVDALSLARSVNLDQFINFDAIPPSWGNLGVAVAFNEALEVVRFPLAVATVAPITRWWERRTGKTSSS